MVGSSGEESTRQCRRCERHGFDPWVWKIPWNWKWQPSPVSCLENSHGQRNLVGYTPQGCKESDTSARTHSDLLNAWIIAHRLKLAACEAAEKGRGWAAGHGVAKRRTQLCSHIKWISVCEFQYCSKMRNFTLISYVFEMYCHEYYIELAKKFGFFHKILQYITNYKPSVLQMISDSLIWF